ncbi:hypothetical protein LINPERHAP2_LOCUS3286 [Linum perenne]
MASRDQHLPAVRRRSHWRTCTSSLV